MLRTNNHKLIQNRLTGEHLLYDLQRDSGEINNIAHKYPVLLSELDGALKDFETRHAHQEQIGAKLVSSAPSKEIITRLKALGYIQ